MMYSYKIEQAIRAAAILHQDQVRKGRAPYPYVAHLFAVSCILADYTTDEDVIIAGLLHDTLEDTDYTENELEKDFGARVRAIVEGVSERMTPQDSRPRAERKRAYLRTLETASDDSLMVATADKIHNLRSIVEEYDGHFSEYMRDFNGTREERMQFYTKFHAIVNQRLTNDIIHEFNHVFNEYKNFNEKNSA